MKKLLIPMILAGCAQIGGPLDPGYPSPVDDTCGAQIHARMIGASVTQLEKTLLLQPVRIILPNTAVTMDYQSDRINFHLTEERVVQKITCG